MNYRVVFVPEEIDKSVFDGYLTTPLVFPDNLIKPVLIEEGAAYFIVMTGNGNWNARASVLCNHRIIGDAILFCIDDEFKYTNIKTEDYTKLLMVIQQIAWNQPSINY